MKVNVSLVLFLLGLVMLLVLGLIYVISNSQSGGEEHLSQKPVLIIATDTDLREMSTVSERMKLDVFRDILASHWDLPIYTTDALGASTLDLANYRAVFVINTNNTPFPESLQMALRTAPKLALIGYTTMSEEERSALIDVTHLEHEGVEFLYKGAYIFPSQFIDTHDLLDEAEVQEIAHALSGSTSVPFIVESAERMFISLNLPNFYETDSHTTIFLSAIEQFLGLDNEPKSNEALVRLEDINPFTYRDTRHLRDVFMLLTSHNAGFNLAVIPQYLNPPLGTSLALSDSPDLVELISEYEGRGAVTLIQHGYTHQTGDEESAIGFEFWNISANAPLEHDSAEFVRERVSLGRAEMVKSGLPVPLIWETPHYTLSELDNKVINELYGVRYERTREFGGLPFVITRTFSDGNEVVFIPENLNYIEGEADIDRIERELKQLGTISSSTPSFFWHPRRNIDELERMLDLFRREGYTFVTAEALLVK